MLSHTEWPIVNVFVKNWLYVWLTLIRKCTQVTDAEQKKCKSQNTLFQKKNIQSHRYLKLSFAKELL